MDRPHGRSYPFQIGQRVATRPAVPARMDRPHGRSQAFSTSTPGGAFTSIMRPEASLRSTRTSISPFGWGTTPLTLWSGPRCGVTRIFRNPGAAESTPSTVRKNSIFGLAPQAWRLERVVGESTSAHVVNPSFQHELPRAQTIQILVSEACLHHGPVQVVPEIHGALMQVLVRCHPLHQVPLLNGLGHIRQDGQHVGML